MDSKLLVEDREKCLLAWKNCDQSNGSCIDWHYFKRAWDICANYGNLQYHKSGEVNYDAIHAVIEGFRINKHLNQ